MFLTIIVKVEADQFSFLGVDVLDLVGDKSDSDWGHINKEMVVVALLVDKEIHEVIF